MPTSENHLIELLPHQDRLRLIAVSEKVVLTRAQVLSTKAQVIRYIYFPIDSFVSLVAQVDEHSGLGVGMVGREGMLGLHVVLGVAQAPLSATTQGTGTAWRIRVASFEQALVASEPLRHCMECYLHVLMVQMVTSIACQRFHAIAPRLARWLLMSQDRAHSNQFHVTHIFLASMLGVRRVSITLAASELQRNGLIEYRRGEMTVLNRAGLEAAACSCYATDCKTYSSYMDGASDATH